MLYYANMNIVVFGASGKVGRLVTQKLLEQGHTVTAFVHRASLPDPGRLRTVKGDVHNVQQVGEAVRGNEAVVCVLGSWGTPTKDIISAATRNIIAASRQHDIQRLVSLSGADARAAGDELGIIHRVSHMLIGLVAKKVLRDGEAHIALLQQSDLDWTVIRSPIMRNTHKGRYTLSTARPLPWATIGRQQVADAIVEQITADNWTGQSPFIRRAR